MSTHDRNRTHALRRTSKPGQPWLGECTLCGGVGFAQYQAEEYCPGKNAPAGNGTLDKVEGKGRRQYRDRGDTRWPEIDGGHMGLTTGGPRPKYAQDAIGVPREIQWGREGGKDSGAAKHRGKGWFTQFWEMLFGWIGRGN